MKAHSIAVGIVGLVLLVGVASAQGVYRWVDENGVTSYGETPPDGVEAVRTDVRYSRTDQSALQARLDDQRAVQDAVDTRKSQDREEAEDAKQVNAENEKLRKENCQLAMDRQRKYDQARRLYRMQEGGGRDYLTDAELDAERAEANRQVNEWCGKN
jgi:hypothetical protein